MRRKSRYTQRTAERRRSNGRRRLMQQTEWWAYSDSGGRRRCDERRTIWRCLWFSTTSRAYHQLTRSQRSSGLWHSSSPRASSLKSCNTHQLTFPGPLLCRQPTLAAQRSTALCFRSLSSHPVPFRHPSLSGIDLPYTPTLASSLFDPVSHLSPLHRIGMLWMRAP